MITIRDLLTILDAKVLCGEEQLDEEVRTACGSDLMSDVLAFVKDKSILITGLTNVHVMRTAEMLDIHCVVFARGKIPPDAVLEEAIPMLSEHSDNISFNKALYNRIAAIYNADQSNLTREQQVVLKKHFDSFAREGIGLDESKQAELREINAKMASLTQKIGNNILAESNAFAEKFGFSVSAYPDKMTSTEDRELRRQYNEAYKMRGHNGNEYDNSELIFDLLRQRIRKAQILGYDTPAAYTLADKMAATPQTVDNFLAGIMTAANAKSKEECLKILELYEKSKSTTK